MTNNIKGRADKPTPSEHDEQAAIFEWAQYQIGRCPDLEFMFAVPNWRPKESQRIYLAAEGVKPGVPDIVLPAARGGFFGLYIEMKVGKNKPTKDQEAYIIGLKGRGYLALVCWGFDEAKQVIEDYLSQPYTKIDWEYAKFRLDWR
jgi:hypothetical protein